MNPLVRDIPPSAIRALNDMKRPDAVDLGLGQPLLGPDMAPLEEALGWIREHGCPYSPNAGFPELRAAIARHYGYPGLDRAENACVTVGSQEALYLVIKGLLAPQRDEALVVTPTFPAYQKLCHMEGVAVREVLLDPADGFRPDAARVLAAVTPRTRLICLASPCNPTGRVWPEAELRALCAGLAALPEPPYLLSDEVYAELYYTPERPASPAAFYPRTLVASSLSKSCALTGLRLGWLLAPADVAPTLFKAHQFAVSCADTLAQRAALAIFQRPELLGAHLGHYRGQHAAICEVLDEAGLSYVPPDGAFYCMVRLRGRAAADSMAAARALMQDHNVVAIPSSVFGVEGFLRLSFVAPRPVLREGARRIAALLDAMA
ncbi:MAG: pyridoxal phosphate-dependent aminotransferase [Polyangia bacterium]